ncbi:hypothetical protein NA57DRAFT_12354, partial [Rhizodiscina lignyota]
QIGDCLGRGAFGSVYRAINFRNGETVAIKQIRLENLPQGELKVIMSEIDLLKNLDHPNIVKYHGYTRDSSVLNIILEYCENGSLHSILKNFGKFPEDLVAIYMSQVLTGLMYLHNQGVIHRDIKGANILTTKEGLVKLADFGVATKASTMNEASVVGTPYWMAPEVIELTGATTSSDIWSLGCTVIELLDGKPPYHKLQPMPALFRIVNDDHPPLPGGASPAVRDFLMQCFQKDPNLRVSAKKLLRHPWISSARRGDAEELNKATDYKEAIKSVQEWNEALRSPTHGSLRKTGRLPSLSPAPPRTAAARAPDISLPPTSTSHGQTKLPSNLPKTKTNPEVYRSPETESDSTIWDDDFATPLNPTGLQLAQHLKPQDHFGGMLSSEKLKEFSKSDILLDEPLMEDYDRTVRSPVQLTRTDPLKAMRPFTPTSNNEYRFTSTTTNGSPMRSISQSKNLAIRTATKAPQAKSSMPSAARPALYREESSMDYSDLVTDDVAFQKAVHARQAQEENDSFSPKLFHPSHLKNAARLAQHNRINGSVRRRLTPTEDKENVPLQRTDSELEIEKYADNDGDLDLSDLLDKDESGSDRSTLMIKPSNMMKAGLSSNEDEEEDDPFAQLDEGFDETMDMEENIARDRHARMTQAIQNIVDSINPSQLEEVLFERCDQLMQYLAESPDAKDIIVKCGGVLPTLEILETSTRRDLLLPALKIINEIIFDDWEVHEHLCEIGGIPIVTKFAGKNYARDIRMEAAAFIRQMYQSSPQTLQIFIGSGGLKILAALIEEDLVTERDMVLIGLMGLQKVFDLQGITRKNDYCRILSRNQLLAPLADVLNQILDEDSEIAELVQERVVNLFYLFSQSAPYVQELSADRQVLSSLLNDLDRMKPTHRVTMLKFIKHLSMLSTTHEALLNSGAIELLINLLKNAEESSSQEVENQVLNILWNLCKHNKPRQEFAAKKGIIPLLMEAGSSGRAVKEFALPILCEMAHSGKSGRKALWANRGLQFYIRLLGDLYYQTQALDAIFVWLQEETARVEQGLLDGAFSDAIVQCFTNKNTSSDVFENLLEPLQKIVRLSPAVAACLARDEIFVRTVQKLQTKKPIVRVSLLRVIRDICEATDDRCASLLLSSGLLDSLRRVQQDQALLAREIATELLKFAE